MLTILASFLAGILGSAIGTAFAYARLTDRAQEAADLAPVVPLRVHEPQHAGHTAGQDRAP